MKKFFITLQSSAPLVESLFRYLPEKMHAAIPNAITSGGVWLNKQRLLAADTMIKAGQTLTVYFSQDQGEKYSIAAPDIVYEDNELLAVFKPPGINVQPDFANINNNLSFGAYRHLENTFAPTAITRLDRPVAGIVLFGKDKKAEQHLFLLSREKKIHKMYLALLEGTSIISCTRCRDRLSFEKQKAKIAANGKNSHSLFIRRHQINGNELFSVIIFTGRRHQIRFHASQYLNPIVGDRKYGAQKTHGPHTIGLLAYGYNLIYNGKRIRLRLRNGEKYLTCSSFSSSQK